MPQPMRVKDMIEKLETLNPDLRVFTACRQGGFCDPFIGRPEVMALDVYTSKCYGPHEVEQLTSMSRNGGNIRLEKGVIIWNH